MNALPLTRFLIAGQLQRSYILTALSKSLIDVPGGSLLYGAAGLALWESGIGLIARIGEDYPQSWLEEIAAHGLDTRGIHVLPEAIERRFFIAYTENDAKNTDNPVAHFARLGLPYPKTLLGYTPPEPKLDSRTQSSLLTIRQNDFPTDYLDATAAHLCPLDLLSHTLLPSVLRRGHVTTITLDPGENYMNPAFWDDMPVLLNGLTAFLCSETKIMRLFQGRSTDLWEMAETLASYGCDHIVIKRGSQGQYFYDRNTRARWIVPAYPVQAIDPTGAGDAFCGGFLAGYRGTYDPLQAVLTGNISAAMSVEGSYPFYALDGLPGLAQARLASLRETIRRA